MKDTVKSLMESAVTPHMNSATKNRIAFSGLRSISEAAADIIRFTRPDHKSVLRIHIQ